MSRGRARDFYVRAWQPCALADRLMDAAHAPGRMQVGRVVCRIWGLALVACMVSPAWSVQIDGRIEADEWKDADLPARVDATLALLLRGLKAC